MPASEVTNDTRLPRAVRIRSSKLDEKYGGKGKSPDPAEPLGAQANQPPNGEADPPAIQTPPADPPPAPPVQIDMKEVERLRQVNSSVTSRIRIIAEERRVEQAAWRQEKTELLEQIRNLQAKQPPAPVDLSKHFTAEEIEALGETHCRALVATAERIAQASINEAVEAAVKPLREKQAATEQSASEDGQERYVAELVQLAPNCIAIDESDEWKQWLGDVDPASGIVRQKLLDHHNDRRDAGRVAKIFQQFVAETTPAPVAAPVPPPVAARGTGAQPDGGSPPGPAQRGTLTAPTPEEISDFYRRAATKRPGQSGYVTEQERVEFEARMELLFQR